MGFVPTGSTRKQGNQITGGAVSRKPRPSTPTGNYVIWTLVRTERRGAAVGYLATIVSDPYVEQQVT